MPQHYMTTAINTLKASWWEYRLAWLLGHKETDDAGCRVTTWRGKTYC